MTYERDVDLSDVCQGFVDQWIEENTYECDHCGLQVVGEPVAVRMSPDETLYYCPVCKDILGIKTQEANL